MKGWLRNELSEIRPDIINVYLFGSSIQSDKAPRDVDLVIVTFGGAGTPSWQRVTRYQDILRKKFDEAFRLPLSVIVATPSEWNEIDGIIVRQRVSIF